MPEVVAAVAAEERVLDHLTLTAEPGVIGGMPQGGLDFGAAVNTQALLHQNQQFDFYDGGGLDLACLGMAEVDASATSTSAASGRGWRARAASSTSARTRAGWSSPARSPPAGWRSSIEDGKVRIVTEGRTRKFVDAVEQITFSGALAARQGPVGALRDRALRLQAASRRACS